MNIKLKPIVSLWLIIIVLLSACSTSEFTAVKRKYRPGYNLSHKEKQAKISSAKTTIADSKKINQNQPSVKTLEELANNNTGLSKEEHYPITASTENQIHAASPSKSGASIMLSETTKEKKGTLKKKIATKLLERKINKHTTDDVDSETILLVILSLFPILALIAIYLKDGEAITTNFWVDLVLHLTIIGYAIFAVLVVLDVINLA